MPEDKSFLLNMLVGTRHHLLALAQSLEILQRQIESGQDPDESGQDPRNPVCPKCGGSLSDISAMGAVRKEYQCVERVCDFRGVL